MLDHWDNFYHRLVRSDDNTRGTSVINGNNDVDFTLEDMKDRFSKAEKNHCYLGLISGNHDTWRIANYLDEEQLRMFYMFLLSMPGIPFILYGDEIAMKTIHMPSKDGGFQRTGTRIPMIWNDEEGHGFSTNKDPYLPFNKENTVSVKQAMKDKDSLYNFIRELISLRKTIRDLSDPYVQIKEKDRVFTFERGRYQLVMNMSDHDCLIEGKIVISSGDLYEKLPPKTAALVKK